MIEEIINLLFEKLEEHWVKLVTAAGFMVIGWFFGKRRASKNWQNREFFDRVNISLNIIRDGKLQLRTLREDVCESIFPNTMAAETIIEAAKRTTVEDPILDLPKDDYWYYLNAILNEMSEQFAAGVLRRDLGLPVTCAEFAICLTSEADDNIRMRKIRALVIRKSLLESLPADSPKTERQTHLTRWRTLQKMAISYQRHPDRFLIVELCQ